MDELTFSHNGATITLHRDTVGDATDAEWLTWQLLSDDASERQRYRAVRYTQFLFSIARYEGELGFDLPSRDAPAEQHRIGMEAFHNADAELARAWNKAYNRLNMGANDSSLQPDTPEKNDESPT